MVLTSDVVRHELSRVEALIAILKKSFPSPGDELEDLRWLDAQRAELRALLTRRQAQRGKRVVSLAVWRGGSPCSTGRPDAAAA